jgi:hypothetical protein
MYQLGYNEERGNSCQWQVHLLTEHDLVTVTKVTISCSDILLFMFTVTVDIHMAQNGNQWGW